MSAGFDKVKAVLEVVRSALQTTLYIFVVIVTVVVILSQGARARIATAVTDMAAAGVESVKFAGTELKLRERIHKQEKEILAFVNNPPPAPVPPKKVAEDVAPTPTASSALQTITPPATFWTYVGQYQEQNKKYLGRSNYDTNKVPVAGDQLAATTSTYKRADRPQLVGNDEWKLGKIVGVVREGQQITVQSVETVEGGNVWVRATAANGP